MQEINLVSKEFIMYSVLRTEGTLQTTQASVTTKNEVQIDKLFA